MAQVSEQCSQCVALIFSMALPPSFLLLRGDALRHGPELCPQPRQFLSLLSKRLILLRNRLILLLEDSIFRRELC